MKRPVALILAAVLVLLLVLISAIWPMVGGQRLMGVANFGDKSQVAQGNPPNGALPGRTPPAALGNTSGNFSPNDQSTGSMNNGTGAPTLGQGMRAGRANGFQGNRILEYILYSVLLILGLVAIGGLWLAKRWGIVVSIILSAIVLIETLPGLFRTVSTLNLIEAIVKIVLAIGILILVVLPRTQLEKPLTQ